MSRTKQTPRKNSKKNQRKLKQKLKKEESNSNNHDNNSTKVDQSASGDNEMKESQHNIIAESSESEVLAEMNKRRSALCHHTVMLTGLPIAADHTELLKDVSGLLVSAVLSYGSAVSESGDARCGLRLIFASAQQASNAVDSLKGRIVMDTSLDARLDLQEGVYDDLSRVDRFALEMRGITAPETTWEDLTSRFGSDARLERLTDDDHGCVVIFPDAMAALTVFNEHSQAFSGGTFWANFRYRSSTNEKTEETL